MIKNIKKVDWTKALVLFFSISASIGIAIVLWAVKEALGFKINLATYAVLSLHILPSLSYYLRYISGKPKNWKRNTMFLALFLVAQAIMGVGTLGFQMFVNGASLAVALAYAAMGVLFIKLVLLGTVILPPVMSIAEKIMGVIVAVILASLWAAQTIFMIIVVVFLTPTATAAIFNSLAKFLGIKLRLPFAFDD